MTLGEHQEAFAVDLAKLLFKATELGYKIRIREVQRTPEQQQIYLKTGASKTMNSMHLKSCAADVYFLKNGQIVQADELGKYWESLDPLNQAGMFWPSFKDTPHFERRC